MNRSKAFGFRRCAGLAAAVLAGMVFVGCEGDEPVVGIPGSFTDSRDGRTYRTVKIGGQTWMAENLNYNADGGKCYGEGAPVYRYDENYERYSVVLSDAEIQANCDTYGRLYDWATAMGLSSDCNVNRCSGQVRSKHQGICPDGWHVPHNDEWTMLTDIVGGERTAGTKLKSASGWHDGDYDYIPGTDDYGFSALPGGDQPDKYYDGFINEGDIGSWWTATTTVRQTNVFDASKAWTRHMYCNNKAVNTNFYGKTTLNSLRCVAD